MPSRPPLLHTSYRQGMAVYKTPTQRTVVGIGVLILLLLPLQASIRQIDIATAIMFAIPAAMALNLLIGVAGLISLATIAFIAVGAFTAAALGSELGLPMAVVLLAGTLVSVVLGTLVGLPALRLRGLYLVVATMAFHFIVIYVARSYQDPRVGVAGFRMPRAELFGHAFNDRTWYVIFAVLAVLSTIAYTNLLRSSWGRAWTMIRERDIAAEVLGINITRYKVLAFTMTSAVTGFMGVLFAYYLRTVEVEKFHLDISIDYVAIIIIGGLAVIRGAIFGSLLVFGIPFLINEIAIALPRDSWLAEFIGFEIFNINRIIYGLAIIFFLLFEPKGLDAIWGRIKKWFALYPFSRERS